MSENNHLEERVRILENNQFVATTEIKGIREALERLESMLKSVIEKTEANYVTKDQLALYTKDLKYGKVVGGLIGSLITIVVLGIVGFLLPEINS